MTVTFNNEVDRNHPAPTGVEVTPNDAVDLTNPARAIYVGVTGDMKITPPTGSAYTLVAMAAGVVHPIQAIRIWATGTTATSIVAFQ